MYIWLRNKDNGNIYPVGEQSPEYAFMRGIRSSVDNRPLYEEIGLQEVTADQPLLPFTDFVIVKYFGAVNTAADDVNTSLGLCPADATLSSVAVLVSAQFTGQATNYRTLTLFDDGSPANAGAAYAQVAPVTLASQAYSANTNVLNTGQENVLAQTGNPAVNNNDILRFASIHSGTGEAAPDGVVLATFARKS